MSTLTKFLCKHGIHWYKEKECVDRKAGKCPSPHNTYIIYVCQWCGKRRKVKVW